MIKGCYENFYWRNPADFTMKTLNGCNLHGAERKFKNDYYILVEENRSINNF